MTDNTIQLKKSDILRLNIKDEEGNDTGEYLEFDLEDIELPLKYQDLIEKDKKNKELIRNQFIIIEKRQDVKGKKLLSKNEEDKWKALNEFLKKEEELYNQFLGENAVKKLTNGRKIGWTTFNELDEIIVQQILPHLDLSLEKISNKIKEKYKVVDNKEASQENILKWTIRNM